MGDVKYTPGPWIIEDPYDEVDGTTYPAHIHGGCRELEVCQFNGDWRVSDIMIERGDDVRSKRANARLIAAAPDMLEALKELAKDPRDDGVCVGDGWDYYTDAVNYARAAIAKAEGK